MKERIICRYSALKGCKQNPCLYPPKEKQRECTQIFFLVEVYRRMRK